MAYKSKEKFLERDGKTLSYCHVDPKLGKQCTAHIHPADFSQADAKRLRELGEELISIAESASNVDTKPEGFVTPEELLERLGLGEAKPKTPAEANKWIEENSTPVETKKQQLENGIWWEPNPEFGNPSCAGCGNKLEQRMLNTGQRVWHHIDHAELDSYFDLDNDDMNYMAMISNTFDELSESDVDIIKANVNIGNTYQDQTEYAYAPSTVGRAWGTPMAESSHGTYPAQCCSKCGSQDLKKVYPRTGFLKLQKSFEAVPKCGNCGNVEHNFRSHESYYWM